jgi:hypothetical protein
MLDYGRKLQRFANEDDLVPGLGLPSIHGGEWEEESRRRDVVEVFRMFVDEVVAREVRRARARVCVCVFGCVVGVYRMFVDEVVAREVGARARMRICVGGGAAARVHARGGGAAARVHARVELGCAWICPPKGGHF